MALSVNDRTFRQEVLKSSQPVLVDFWAPWCGLCQIIQPILREFHLEWGNQVKVVRVNADNNFKLANTYKLKSLPTLLFVENGKVVYRLENFQGRDELRLVLKKLMLNSLPNSA
ncbi:MAG: conjugal transfer protein TraF [Symploca sp. SIO2E6]|nr:conjugal transfer protein TraF [Symploca sp. SIO2E6]